MAPLTIPTTTPVPSSGLDTPVIIIICVCAYLAFFIVAIFIRQCLVESGNWEDCKNRLNCCRDCSEEKCWLSLNNIFQPLESVWTKAKCDCEEGDITKDRGFCAECHPCGKAEDENNCCECCISLAGVCNCSVPGTNCCGNKRQRCDIGDCFACCSPDNNCCADQGDCFCSGISLGCCDCPGIKCEKPECQEIHCLCCVCSCKDGGTAAQPYPPYPGYQYPGQTSLPRTSQPYPYSSHPIDGVPSRPSYHEHSSRRIQRHHTDYPLTSDTPSTRPQASRHSTITF